MPDSSHHPWSPGSLSALGSSRNCTNGFQSSGKIPATFQQAERLEDLDQKMDSVSSMFDGVKKIVEGMQAMEALQTPKP